LLIKLNIQNSNMKIQTLIDGVVENKLLSMAGITLILGALLLSTVGEWVSLPLGRLLNFTSDHQNKIKKVPFIPICHDSICDNGKIIGKKDLLARSSEIEHLKITSHQALKNYSLENVSLARKVLFTHDSVDFYIREWQLKKGDKVTFGKTEVTIDEASEDQLNITVNGKETYTIKESWSQNLDLSSSRKKRLQCKTNFKEFIDDYTGKRKEIYLGGEFYCEDTIPLDDIQYKSFVLEYKNDSFYLRPNFMSVFDKTLVRLKREGITSSLKNNQLIVENNKEMRVTIGRSRYRISFASDTVNFYPLSTGLVKDTDHYFHKAQGTAKESLFNAGILAWVICGVIAIFIGRASKQNSDYEEIPYKEIIILLAVISIILRIFFDLSDIAMLLMISVLGTTLFTIHKYGIKSKIFMLLSVTNLLVLMGVSVSVLLATKSNDTKYIYDFSSQNKYLLIGYLFLFAILYNASYQIITQKRLYNTYFGRGVEKITEYYSWFINKTVTPMDITLVQVLGLGLILFLSLFSSETGLWGFQPAEFIKLYLCVICANFAVKLTQYHSYKDYFLLILWFFVIVFFVYQMSDFSYFIILSFIAFYAILGTLLFRFGERIPEPPMVLYLVILFSPFLLYYFWAYGIGVLVDNWDILENYKRRIDTWRYPVLFPHSGYQVNYARELIANLCFHNECKHTIQNLTNVDDDFALTAILFRGKAWAFLLISLQIMWVTAFYLIIQSIQKYTEENKDQVVFLTVFILAGLGVFISQTLIAWSTNLGLLPVMGQPMPFIGRQGSHLVLFLFPFIVIVTYLYLKLENKKELEQNNTTIGSNNERVPNKLNDLEEEPESLADWF